MAGTAEGGRAVKYLLLIYNKPEPVESARVAELIRGHAAVYRELADAGKLVSSASLTTPLAATTVHLSESGVPAVTDGPFLETKEFLAGYYLVDCATRDEALEIAARIPCGRAGAVEVRAVDEEVTRTVRGEQS